MLFYLFRLKMNSISKKKTTTNRRWGGKSRISRKAEQANVKTGKIRKKLNSRTAVWRRGVTKMENMERKIIDLIEM